MRTTLVTYTIERLSKPEEFTDEINDFLIEEVPKISKMFGDKFDYRNVRTHLLAQAGIFLICRRNGVIRGLMLAFLSISPLDCKTKILKQQLFYVKPDSGRTAFYLFKKFIDIGKTQADHIITTLTSQTNIKAETLEKMGFSKLEVSYRMEINSE